MLLPAVQFLCCLFCAILMTLAVVLPYNGVKPRESTRQALFDILSDNGYIDESGGPYGLATYFALSPILSTIIPFIYFTTVISLQLSPGPISALCSVFLMSSTVCNPVMTIVFITAFKQRVKSIFGISSSQIVCPASTSFQRSERRQE
ncbi:hypothetical protein Ddc_14346 [Ditylenchus destructor]|nr:hypothetical protein Ddc_14346 [Ditylenchus destructor]